jgi:hypothetical protein
MAPSTQPPLLESLIAAAHFPADVFPSVEKAALGNPRYHDALARSHQLSQAAWLSLYPVKPLPPIERAEYLADRPLTTTQHNHIAANETRARIIQSVAERYGLSPQAQERLATGKGLSAATASILLHAPWATPEARRAVAIKQGGLSLLEWAATSTPQELPDAELIELLSQYHDWQPTQAKSSVVKAVAEETLIETRPHLIPVFIAAGVETSLCQRLATSRHLTNPDHGHLLIDQVKSYVVGPPLPNVERQRTATAILADLIGNPVVSHTVAQKASELAELRRLTRYTGAATIGRATSTRKDLDHVIAARRDHIAADSGVTPQDLVDYDNHIADGAIVVPFENITDQFLQGIAFNRITFDPAGTYALAALAKNPHLGQHAKQLVVYLNRWASVAYAESILAPATKTFRNNYPHLNSSHPSPKLVAELLRPNIAKAQPPTPYFLPRYASPQPHALPTGTTPDRYEYPLVLMSDYFNNDPALTGVAYFLSDNVGSNPSAWTTLLGIADSFVDSDAQSLVDTVVALTAATQS